MAWATLLVSSVAQAQTTQATSGSGRPTLYRLQAEYHAGVAQAYEIVEQTTTKRTFEDGNVATYDRKVKYFTTVRCIESIDGISTLVINVDSLLYSFTSEGETVEYDSQHDITPKAFIDLNNYIGPLNRPFQITVSSYGGVSDVKGEQVEFWRDYLKENAVDLDSVTYLVWMQSLADENLLNYGDLQKRVIPGLKVAIDSSWEHGYNLRLDGVQYTGRINSTFKDYSGGYFTITSADTIQALPQDIHTYGLPVISRVLEGAAVIDNTVEVSNGGTVTNVQTIAKAWFRGQALNVKFKQETTATISWNLTGQYQW